MIPIQSADRVVTQNSNVGRSMNYRLDARNLRHIVTMLRDSVYSNKILAVIREYSTNALDAHTAAEEAGMIGRRTLPIEVHLPTKFSSELRIRDFGLGLTEQEIEEIYISLGESTKRQSNKFVGSLGFGSKSAFAYGDRFVITSWNSGRKVVYDNVLDDNVPEGARCDIMASAPCAPDESGIEICIPIKQHEISECKQIALNFFKYWTTFPTLTGADAVEISEALAFKKNKSIFSGENWIIYPTTNSYGSSNNKGIALMGDVPYSLDWELIKRKLVTAGTINSTTAVLFNFIQANNAILTFDIGQLEFSVSRESLQYTDFTCQAIFKRVETILTSIQKIIEKVIAEADTIWEAKRLYGVIFNCGYELGGEKSEFGGELRLLEPYFKGRLKWKNILVDSQSFSGVHNWEVDKGKTGTTTDSYRTYDENYHGIMTTFHDDRGKLRQGSRRYRRRRSYYSAEGVITPSKTSVVLINDLDKPHGFLTIVRYLVQRGDSSAIKRVYALKFGKSEVKDAFYKEYNFDTVPVTYASALLETAKKWYATIKPSATRNGGAPTGPLPVRSFSRDVNGNKKFTNRHWSKRDILLKELKKVTYYVPVDGDSILTGRANRSIIEPYHFTEHIVALDNHTDWFKDIDVIYGILPRTVKSKWFTAAAKAGRFINLFDYLNKQVSAIDLANLAEARAYKEYTNRVSGYVVDTFIISKDFATKLLPNLKFKDGVIYPLCQAFAASHSQLLPVDTTIQQLGFVITIPPETKAKTDYRALAKAANTEYPLMNLIGVHVFNRSSTLDSKMIQEIAHYINLVDADKGCKKKISVVDKAI